MCGCYSGGYKCDQECVERSLIDDSLFYPVGVVRNPFASCIPTWYSKHGHRTFTIISRTCTQTRIFGSLVRRPQNILCYTWLILRISQDIVLVARSPRSSERHLAHQPLRLKPLGKSSPLRACTYRPQWVYPPLFLRSFAISICLFHLPAVVERKLTNAPPPTAVHRSHSPRVPHCRPDRHGRMQRRDEHLRHRWICDGDAVRPPSPLPPPLMLTPPTRPPG